METQDTVSTDANIGYRRVGTDEELPQLKTTQQGCVIEVLVERGLVSKKEERRTLCVGRGDWRMGWVAGSSSVMAKRRTRCWFTTSCLVLRL